MALSSSYYTVNRRLIGQKVGVLRIDYLTDALGSVTMTVDQSASIQGTLRYKPYGQVLASTGDDSKFGWNGTHGYRKVESGMPSHYIRMRHYADGPGVWTSRDLPLPSSNKFLYAASSPTVQVDPGGLVAIRAEFNTFINKRDGEPFRYFTGRYFFTVWNPISQRYEYGETDNRTFGERGSAKHWSWATAESTLLDQGSRACSTGIKIGNSRKVWINQWTGEIEQEKLKGVYGTPPKETVGGNENSCGCYVRHTIRACTPWLPWFLQTSAYCIDYDIIFRFTVVRPNVVAVTLFGQHDRFPDYEAKILAPGPSRVFYTQAASRGLLSGGLKYVIPFNAVTQVIAETPKCCS